MRVAIFFVCLCYLLLGGYNYLFTGTHGFSPSTLHLVKSNQKFTDNKQGLSVVKAANSGQPEANLITDIEDEESNDSTARKYKLLAKCLYALANAFVLTWLYNRFRSSKPHYPLFAFKYITQRVLRI